MKWTQERRRKVYSRLMQEFGLHANWGAKIEPHGKTSQFNKVLCELASELSADSHSTVAPSAIHAQLNWATTSQGVIKNRSHVTNFILNKAAALEVGFISSEEVPAYLSISN